ncbi:MAG: ABC transporter ATP-binding protein [Oscillospiraceae bacterium]
MIEYKNVTKTYGNQEVVKNLNLRVSDGEFVVLIGPSGCGKTTTLKMMNRLIEMDSGEILIDGKNIADYNPEQLRRNIGYVIQQIGLFPNMTVEENIGVVPKLLKWDKERIHKRVTELLELVGMTYEESGNKYPNEMSGGQQQRIGVLRALAAEPPIILMDEPFGALDPITRDSLQDEVKQLQKRLGITTIFVTHDMNEAIKMADRIVFMYGGEILQADTPEELLRAPANDIVREFMGKHVAHTRMGDAELMCADVMKKKIATVEGSKKTLECVEMMSVREVDSLIVVDEHKKYLGVAKIETLRERGEAGQPITKVTEKNVPTVFVSEHAQAAFTKLVDSKLPYVIVLDENEHVVGIITRTSMSKALASVVWGYES